MLELIILVIVGTTIWVGFDAKDRDWSGQGLLTNSATGWVLGSLLVWIVVFPMYLAARNRVPRLDA